MEILRIVVHPQKNFSQKENTVKKKVVTFSRNETFCMRFHCQFVLEQAPQKTIRQTRRRSEQQIYFFRRSIPKMLVFPRIISHSGERKFFLIWNLGRTLIIWTDTRCSFLKFLLNDGDLTWAAQAHNEEKAVFHVKSVYIIITIIAAVFFRKLFRSFSSFFWLSFSFFVWSASERKCDKSIRNND